MQDMLHISRDNINMAQDRTRFYANQYRHLGQKVFLCVPHDSTMLSTSKHAKISPTLVTGMTK